MADVTGSEILASCLKKEGTKDLFFIMGGPMQLVQTTCPQEEIRMIDVRHEQAAALSAQAYSRLLQKPGVAWGERPRRDQSDDRPRERVHRLRPVVALGGSSAIGLFGRQTFQEIDQLAIMKPMHEMVRPRGQPEAHSRDGQQRFSEGDGRQTRAVYLDFPADSSTRKSMKPGRLAPSGRPLLNPRPLGEPARVDELIDALAKAKQPLVVSGSGVIWSQAWDEMQQLRGEGGYPVLHDAARPRRVPDDHPLSFLTMRSTAFKDADLIIILGTRMNYIIGHGVGAALRRNAKIARIEIDARRARHRAAQDRYPYPSATARRC